MLPALLLLAAAPQTPIEAERAFDKLAAKDGQWTAFRATASADAMLFVPQPVKAQDWLKDKSDPPKTVRWQPAESYLSCDGSLAVNTGPWQRPNGTTGYFTTVWRREGRGWKWVLDHGDALDTPRKAPKKARARKASCHKVPGQSFNIAAPQVGGGSGAGQSHDGTLAFDWRVEPDGARVVKVRIWNGTGFDDVLSDSVKASQ